MIDYRYSYLASKFAVGIFVFGVANSSTPFAQTVMADLSGRIVDETKLPVAGVKVSLARLPLTGTTGTDGRFRLQGTAAAIRSTLSPALQGNSNVTYSPRDTHFGLTHAGAWWSPTGRKLKSLEAATADPLNPADQSIRAALLKMAAIDDTLKIEMGGYTSKKMAITIYTADMGDITLTKPIVNASCNGLEPPSRGLKVRYIASQGVELEAGAVKTWKNQIAGGPDAVPLQPAKRPTLKEAALNGKPVLHLDGIDDALPFTFPVSGKTNLTLTAVTRTWEFQRGSPNPDCKELLGHEINCSGTDASIMYWPEEGGGFHETGIFYAIGQTEATFRFGTGNAYPHYKTPYILEPAVKDEFITSIAEANGVDRTLYINGKIPKGHVDYNTTGTEDLKTATPASAMAIKADPTANIGRGRFEAATSYWSGDIAEIMVYDSALDATERADLEKYYNCAYFPDRK